MTQLFNTKGACFGCNACQAICAAEAITMKWDAEGFPYPVIDNERCVVCGSCAEVCPAKHPIDSMDGQAYAVRCNDPQLLQKSASGGAFSLLAEQIIQTGGLVCGAAFDEHFQVHHLLSDDIAPMRMSKYVQSDLTGIYDAIRKALDNGKQVLFTGTPCQCDGVRHFFGAQSGLILAALICRGVQSPGLWKEYLAHLSVDGTVEAYCFRDKRLKNDGHTVSYTVGGQENAVSMGKDPFSRLYMKCLTLRPSCYQCPYTHWELPFDLTIGDYWGVENFRPELADGMGTSLVIARTNAGRVLMDSIRSSALVVESPREPAEQIALREPAKETLLRKLLFRDFAKKTQNGNCDMSLILKKYGG